MSTRILIVEDELIIAEDIKEKIISFGYDIAEVTDHYEATLEILKNNPPDLILLDIALKSEKSGIDIAREIDNRYHIPYIFLTSNHDAATLEMVKSVHPSSYLMKPYKKEELYMAIELAFQSKPTLQNQNIPQPDHVFIKEGHSYQKIKNKDIRYLKSEGVYIEIYTDTKRYITRDSFKNILEKLPASKFLQTHKSYYINTDYITSVSAISVMLGNDEIPLGRTFKDEVNKQLGIE